MPEHTPLPVCRSRAFLQSTLDGHPILPDPRRRPQKGDAIAFGDFPGNRQGSTLKIGSASVVFFPSAEALRRPGISVTPSTLWKATRTMTLEIREHVPLAPLTTLQIGGPARYFAAAHSQTAAQEAFEFAAVRGLPVFVLGGGSNILVSDRGFEGLVLHMRIGGIRMQLDEEGGLVSVGAGENWDDLVAACVGRGLAGVECMSGIPGTVGGTPIQNVGAYGQEVAGLIHEVHVLARAGGRSERMLPSRCGFSYRSSVFNTTEKDRYVVLEVTFRLRRSLHGLVRHKDLKEFFRESPRPPSPAEVRAAVLEIRAAKGMVLRPGHSDSRSAGSFFKNAILRSEELSALRERISAQAMAPDRAIPMFPAGADRWKVPAAWLIEQAGFHKGYTRGRVSISSRHALALVNLGGATAVELVGLMEEIRDKVYRCFGVVLAPEPVFVGFD